MTSNRFKFLELNEQQAPVVTPEEHGPIRFDPPVLSAEDGEAPGASQLRESETDPTPQTDSLRVMEAFGSRGTIAGAFSYPTGVAVDRSGVIFIADAYNHRLQRITPGGGVAVVGSRGTGRGQFIAPMGVAVDDDRSFYVVEQGNHRLQKFSADGIFEMAVGREGGRQGDFRSPTGIAVARGTKMIYVADTGNGRVQCFDKFGKYMSTFGAPGSIHPRLSNPQAVACDERGNIFVADTLAHRIVQFDPGGRFVATYGGVPTPMNRLPDLVLTEPHAIAFDERGRLFIADGPRSMGRLVVVAPQSGTILTKLEHVGRGLGHLARPGGIAPAPVTQSKVEAGLVRGDIYVSDTMNHRILRFVWS